MTSHRRCSACLMLLVAAASTLAPVAAQTPQAQPSPAQAAQEEPRSPRNASYAIDARLDHPTHTISGTALIRWRNITIRPATDLRLHLYWNGWRSTASTWMRERMLEGDPDGFASRPADDFAFINLSELSLLGEDGAVQADLLASLTFVQPDDGNTDDRTLAAVPLPAPARPGQTLTLRAAWSAKVPRTFARTGRIGQFYFIAHWFPKLAVLTDEGWTAHQFHANTEFFSDYGVYDVRLTVPRGWTVGATGVEQARVDHADGTSTHRYTQSDVHDFAWTTSPDLIERRERFTADGLPPVEMRLLLQPEHGSQAERHFRATAAALRYYGEWFGAYPYPQVTIVDPAWQSEAGGMEYPTLFTAGTRWLSPARSGDPEAVTVHEAGHQFWYGVVGNNEFEHAWMDEGLNTFSEARVQAEAFPPVLHVERFFGGLLPWTIPSVRYSRESEGNGLAGYRRNAERDVPSTPTFGYWPGTHWDISYGKTALWLHTLERHLGWDRLRRGLALFYDRFRFAHPRPDDLFTALEEGAGDDLDWFIDQVHRGSNTFDYAIERLDSAAVAVRGFADANTTPSFSEQSMPDRVRTTVVVRRLGEAIFPVDLQVTFDDGHEQRERWDGAARWRAFVYERESAARSAVIDPDRVLLLDINRTNNSRTRAPRAAEAARKWSAAWLLWAQDLLLTSAFFL